jgi:hypothetical protein
MSQSLSGTTVEKSNSRFRNSILVAGLLGGLLGGVTSFAASRFFKPVAPVPPLTAKERAAADARRIVEALLDELKQRKDDEFMAHVKLAWNYHSDDAFNQIKENFKHSRIAYAMTFGDPLNEFEILQENPLNPNLIQFVYMEKYARGAVIWKFVMYNVKDQWRISYLNWFDDYHKASLQ